MSVMPLDKITHYFPASSVYPAVPDLWHYELGSVLVAAKRDNRISASKLRTCQATLRELEFETLAIELDAAEIIDLGLRYHLQGYDVVYFELARRLGIPIATLDGGIRTACGIFHVKLP